MTQAHRQHANVIPFPPAGKPDSSPITRLSPEHDGMELLYANDRHPGTLFSLKILAWARLANGETVALVPWLKAPMTANDLADPLNGRWEGYRLPDSDVLFTQAPEHKVEELKSAARFFGTTNIGSTNTGTTNTGTAHTKTHSAPSITQEIPDTIGTHALFTHDHFRSITLSEVISWRLFSDGTLTAMVAKDAQQAPSPILPGAACLTDVHSLPGFHYFFQHGIANKLKSHDPEALAAVAVLASENPV